MPKTNFSYVQQLACKELEDGLGKAMQLQDAVGLRPGEMACLIGAGGKTTVLFHLAKEKRETGGKVLVTTTTKIFKPAKPHVDRLFLVQEPDALLATTSVIQGPVVIGAGYGINDDGKLIGLPVNWFERLQKSSQFDNILVEADGAASRLFKVPSELEPVIPETCQLTLWVMSVKVLGKPLQPEWVHRAERALALLGARPNIALSKNDILHLVMAPEGCLKGVPPSSRKVALINQADSSEEVAVAEDLARALVGTAFTRVIVTSFSGSEPIKANVVQ